MGPIDPAALSAFVLAAEKAEPSKTPFYIAGAVLAAWAVVVAVIGISRPEFPGSLLRSRMVMGLSVALVAGVATTAIVTAGTPAKGKETAKPGPTPPPGAPPAGASATPPAPGGRFSPPPSASAASSTLALAADPSGQLAYDKQQLQARAGKVTIDFTNKSPVGHDVTIEQNGAKVAASSIITASSTTLTATLKPGKYTFFCSVDSHRQLGMQGTLTVG